MLGLLAGPGPRYTHEQDLAAAIRAARLPGAPPYRGPLDRKLLDEALQGFSLDAAALHWLAATAATAVSG